MRNIRRALAVIIALTLITMSLSACGTNEPYAGTGVSPETQTESENSVSDTSANEEDTKVLVAYFSCTGTTEAIAKGITDATGGTLYQILPEVPYTAADLDYNDGSSRANKEQDSAAARPAIKGGAEGIEKYDVIFLGYPIWWGQAPKIIYTFLEKYDFSGKTIVPFCTSHSSGIGTSNTNLHSLAPTANWIEGKRFAAGASKSKISEWIDSLGLKTGGAVSSFNLSAGENGKAPTVTLNSGYEMPIVGLGTYSLLDDVCVNSVASALQSGFRKIDTAYMYHNEKEVGEGVRKSGVPREEVFVTTKLYPNQYANAGTAIGEALEKLDLGYIDLMLLHHPGKGDVEAYKAMEKAVAEGKIRSIGLSNWYIEEIDGFISQIAIMPALIQNEIHPYYQENEVISYMQGKGIVMEAWYPLGGRGHTKELFENETIAAIAAAHGKSPAQVILRWDLQKGVVVIPGSSNPDHIKENISVFDFELTDEEMNRINALDRGEKHDWY
ncbi:flavodoxin [Parasphaerochaeta coccoides]|uniref:flavodoxin n=1 Tax=Parasphaerochaeta coccoides TaxID=273376 RepID=UPI001FE09558|nr:flavodoxin [Parasphaerochaeta coccoides]